MLVQGDESSDLKKPQLQDFFILAGILSRVGTPGMRARLHRQVERDLGALRHDERAEREAVRRDGCDEGAGDAGRHLIMAFLILFGLQSQFSKLLPASLVGKINMYCYVSYHGAACRHAVRR